MFCSAVYVFRLRKNVHCQHKKKKNSLRLAGLNEKLKSNPFSFRPAKAKLASIYGCDEIKLKNNLFIMVGKKMPLNPRSKSNKNKNKSEKSNKMSKKKHIPQPPKSKSVQCSVATYLWRVRFYPVRLRLIRVFFRFCCRF